MGQSHELPDSVTLQVAVPAPAWRRLFAAVYDGLLLIGLWVATTLVEIVIRGQLLSLPRHLFWLQMLLLVVAAIFFCMSWTRGGQTPGMRAWRLKVQRHDGAALRLPIAVLRCGVMLLTWAAAAAPLFLLVPAVWSNPDIRHVLSLAGLAAMISAAPLLFGSHRRAACDWVAGTDVMQLPAPD